MTIFWLSIVAFVLAGLVIIALPLFRKQSFDDKARRDELNKALYKDRVKELEEEADGGVVSDQADLVVDLKKSLLEDIPRKTATGKMSSLSPMLIFIPSALLFIAISYVTYSTFGALDKVSHWQSVNSKLPELMEKLMSPEQEELTEDELNDFKLALRTKLHYQPDDAQGWLLLGRVALAGRDSDSTVGAMGKAYKLDAENPDIRLGYAQSLMISNNEGDQHRARAMLTGLLKDDYVDLRVYSLLAFDSYQRGNYEEAARLWRTMQDFIGVDDSRYSMLERSIQNAEKMLGTTTSATSVVITIDVSRRVQLSEQGFLIVSVHDGNGASVPLAAGRYPIGSFPRTVVIDDSNVMVEGQSLSQLKSVVVKARIDVDGNVATKEGDWYGESSVTTLGEQVTLTIDNQY